TRPLLDGDAGENVFGRGLACNPAVVLRPSGLVGLECDSEQDLVAIEELGLPVTVTVRSSQPYKRHFWFRPPTVLETVPYVAVLFEPGRVNAARGGYLLCPPAIPPSGVAYSFLRELEETEVVELPATSYSECVRRWQNGEQAQRRRLELDP